MVEISWPKVRVTVDPKAGTVAVDLTQVTNHDLSHLDPDIHLIQWYPEGWGAIEYTLASGRPMVTTVDFNLIHPYLQMHEAALHEAACRSNAEKPAA